MTLSTVGIIPARGGSKGIPGKNLAPLAGKPMIAWTIQTVKQSLHTNRVIVSTDSEEIAQIAKQYEAEVPFLRPPELAQDDTPGIAPILHAIKWLEDNEGYVPDLVMCLQPTSPLRSSKDIDAAIELLVQQKAEAVISVTPVDQHPYWMQSVDPAGWMKDFVACDSPVTRRQDLPPVYAPNGAIYLAYRAVLLERETWHTERTYAYVMPPERSLDVDTNWHLHLAELILKHNMSGYGC